MFGDVKVESIEKVKYYEVKPLSMNKFEEYFKSEKKNLDNHFRDLFMAQIVCLILGFVFPVAFIVALVIAFIILPSNRKKIEDMANEYNAKSNINKEFYIKIIEDFDECIEKNDLEEALNILDKVLPIDIKGLNEYFYEAKCRILLYSGRYAEALDPLIYLADRGNVLALYEIGDIYLYGRGVEKDFGKAFEWFEKSAKKGNGLALYQIGYMYFNGKGVEKDFGKAFEWFKKSAEQGFAPAQYNLGLIYASKGKLEEAFEWFKRAAEEGHVQSQFNISCNYFLGEGVKQSNEKAFKWLEKAAQGGCVDAQHALGLMYYDGEVVGQDYSEAFEWFKKSAEQGDKDSQYELGMMYYNGYGIKQDFEEAFEWFEKSAEQGCEDAITALKKLI